MVAEVKIKASGGCSSGPGEKISIKNHELFSFWAKETLYTYVPKKNLHLIKYGLDCKLIKFEC